MSSSFKGGFHAYRIGLAHWFILLTGLAALPCLGVVPMLLNYQGKLTSSSSTPISGAQNLRFYLYDAPSGGSLLWQEPAAGQAAESVQTTNGLFNVVLGSVVPLSGTIFAGNTYLAVEVNGYLLPRTRLVAAPYAMRSVTTDNLSFPLTQTASSPAALVTLSNTDTAGGPVLHAESSTGDGLQGVSLGGCNQPAGVRGTGAYAGVWGSSGANGSALVGINTGSGKGLHAKSDSGTAADIDGTLEVTGSSTLTGGVTVVGSLSAPLTRYVPITLGDMVTDAIPWCGTDHPGYLYANDDPGSGIISFPVPEDYVAGTPFNLDLYLVPDGAVGAGDNICFLVMWKGFGNDDLCRLGNSVFPTPVAITRPGDIIVRQSVTLSGFSAPLPEYILMNIRRNTDTHAGGVYLNALRLSYQASR